MAELKMPDDAALREENYRLYQRMIKAQSAKDRAGFLACFGEAIVFEAPYYRPDAPLAADRTAMGTVFDAMCERFSSIDYQVKRFIPALDPNLVIVEVRGNNAVAGSDRVYRNDYLFLVSVRAGLITRIFEYSNPNAYARDVDGRLLGPRDRVQAVVLAYKTGLVAPDPRLTPRS